MIKNTIFCFVLCVLCACSRVPSDVSAEVLHYCDSMQTTLKNYAAREFLGQESRNDYLAVPASNLLNEQFRFCSHFVADPTGAEIKTMRDDFANLVNALAIQVILLEESQKIKTTTAQMQVLAQTLNQKLVVFLK